MKLRFDTVEDAEEYIDLLRKSEKTYNIKE